MKNKVFFGVMLIISVLLFLLRMTGLTMHIVLSVAGALLLVGFMVISKKEWKKPALEILMRVLFAVAFISGILVMNIAGVPALSIVHKAAAAGFIVVLLALYLPKIIKKA